MNVDDPELQRPDEETIREVSYALMCLVYLKYIVCLVCSNEMQTVVFSSSDNREDESSLGEVSVPENCGRYASSSGRQTGSCAVHTVCSAGACTRA